MKSPIRWNLVLGILPSLYMILSMIFLIGIKRFYINKWDPTYIYLMNGINLASGHFRIGTLVHPGTPVVIFTAIIISIKHFFTNNTILYQDVLLHPESYLFTCSVILAILLATVVYLSGKYVFDNSKNLGIALLFQLPPLFFCDIIKKVVSISAESIITIFGIWFISYLYINTIWRDEFLKKEASDKSVILFGLYTALLFTTKIYCAPLIILVLFLVKFTRQRIIYLISFGIFSLLLLFPLYHQFRNWLGTIKSMIFHDGFYGQGSAEIIDIIRYRNNLIDIFKNHFAFTSVFILVLFSFLFTIWFKIQKKIILKNLTLPITGIMISFIIFILLIAKQYAFYYVFPVTKKLYISPNFYYFIPLLIFFPIAIVVACKILFQLLPFDSFRIYKQKIFLGILIIFIGWSGQEAYSACYDARSKNISMSKTKEFLDSYINTPLVIDFDGDQFCNADALLSGLTYVGEWDLPKYLDFIKKTIYPNVYTYESWNNALVHWDQKIDIFTILKKDNQALLYMSGQSVAIEDSVLRRIGIMEIQRKGGNCKKIYTSDNHYESIYLVKADSLRQTK